MRGGDAPSLPFELTLVRPSLVTELDELGLRCIQRSRTPATALKKLVEPAASVREIASRVGASCWSSLSSWMPSERRRPMSATTEGFSLHGCLECGVLEHGGVAIVRKVLTVPRRDRTAEGL